MNVGGEGADRQIVERVREVLELAHDAQRSYDLGEQHEKRDLLKITTSNLTANGREASIELSEPFALIANRHSVPSSLQSLIIPRSLHFLPDPAEREDDPERLQVWRLLFGVFETLEELQPASPCAETVETREKALI